MKGATFAAATLVAIAFLSACGADNDDDSKTSTATFQLRLAWIVYQNETGARSFEISGSLDTVSVAGSGTATFGQFVAATFESKPALAKTSVFTGTLTGGGQSVPYDRTSTRFIDSNYLPLGLSSSNAYVVVSGTPSVPLTAKVNDKGTLAASTVYTDSSKSVATGTSTTSYAVQADTSTTAILKIVETVRATDDTIVSTDTATFRMTPAGDLTRLTEEHQSATTSLKLTF